MTERPPMIGTQNIALVRWLEAENEALLKFARKVARYSNDPWLAQEADRRWPLDDKEAL